MIIKFMLVIWQWLLFYVQCCYIYIKKLRQEVTENEENQQKGAENCRASNEK